VKEETARTIANLTVASAGAVAAYVLISKPKLRRTTWRLTQLWLGAGLPAFLVQQVRHAWRDAAPAPTSRT
jgi:hypothetical protein